MEDLGAKIKKILKSYEKKVDYLDTRLKKSQGTLISFRKKEIEDVSLPRRFYGSVRALYKGGWGLVTFNDENQLEEAYVNAIRHAKNVGKEKSLLARVTPVRDIVKVGKKDKQFTKIPLGKKIDILTKYNDLIWEKGEKVVSSSIYYTDSLVESLFISSDRSEIIQQKPYVYSVVSVVASFKGIIQRYFNHLADNNYPELTGKQELVEETVRIAESLTQAPPVKSMIGTVILEPKLAGVFVHEAFGHLSEADNVYKNKQFAKVMRLGKRFGSEIVTIIDDPTIKGFRGSYTYDEEGVRTKKTYLLKNGVLVGRLHSRETATKMEEEVNGHARAQGVSEPQVRMGVTYIAPGNSTFKQMLRSTKKGLYCIGWQAGNTDHEKFTFTAAYGIEIINGKLGKMVRDVKLAGNLFDTLKNIDMVGNKLVFEGGTCQKGGQYLPETSGGPHVRIKNVMIIGV